MQCQRAATGAAKVENGANKAAWFESGLQLRGGWGRHPKGNAPRSEASTLGARWLLPDRHLRGWQRGCRHAPRPNDVGGPTTFPGSQKGGDPAASGDLRLGPRAPGRGGRRASIPLHALTTLLSALGAFCLFEPRVARICPGNLRYICSDNGNASQGADNTSVRVGAYNTSVRAGGVLSVGIPRFLNKSQHFTVHLFRPWRPGSARQRRRPLTVHRGSTHAPRLQRPVASEDEASACSELRLGCHPETSVIEPCRETITEVNVRMDHKEEHEEHEE